MNPDPLVTAFHTVQAMTTQQCVQFYHDHIGRGLDRESADLFQFVCDRLGIKIEWSHYVFKTDSWHNGRKIQE